MSASVLQSPTPPARNLWDVAVTRLSDKEKAHIDLIPTAKLDELLSAVHGGIEECKQRQWTVKGIVLRDVFTKIAKWIEKFIEVGDVTVQYDPGHTALPWAALRFLLKASVQDINQYALVIEGAETVANIVTRYRIVERLYLVKQHEITNQLEEHITDLYALVLKFLVKAKKFYLRNTTIRALKSMTDFSNKLQGCLESIAMKDQETKSYTALADAELRQSFEEEYLKNVLSSLQMPIDRIERDLHDLRAHSGDAKRTQILQWISPIPYEQHHNQARRDLMTGTGRWFLNDDRLLGWRGSSASSIMWLRGIAGSGKSKLISIFIQQQLSEFMEDKNPNPIYFYCARNPAEPERAKPDAVLRSLVRQLSVRNPHEAILEPVRRVYKEREDGAFAAGTLTLEESTALIIELSQCRQLTTIIVDALDECEQSLRLELLDAFNEILQGSNGLIKILVSSRDVGDIVCQLEGCLNLEIQASKNQVDINRFVDWGVDDLIKRKQLLSGKISDDLRQEIKQVLCEKAGGMFRWVSLQLDFLRGLKWEPAVKSRLQKLPTKLLHLCDETYSQNVECRAEEEQTLTKNALSMLLCMQIPLRTGDFMLALCSCEDADLSAEDLIDLCSGFVVLDIALDIFRFAHLSVREFLETKDDYEPSKNHALIAKLCLKYLSTSTVTQSAMHWDNGHAGPGPGLQEDPPRSLVLVHKHPMKTPASWRWMGGMLSSFTCSNCGRRLSSPCTSYHLYVHEDISVGFCKECVEKGKICEHEDGCPLARTLTTYGTLMTPLANTLTTYATIDSSMRREESAGFESEYCPAEDPYPTLSIAPIFLDGFHQYASLYWAFHLSKSMNHRLSTTLRDIAQAFMICEQQQPSAAFVSWSSTILTSAPLGYRDLTWGYDLCAPREVRDGISQPADCIFTAAIWGFRDILELRVNVDPETVSNVSQQDGFPVLHLASAYGNVNAAQMLLEQGAKLEARNTYGYSALGTAINHLQPETLSLLLEHGADIDTKQGDYYPLHQAVKRGHLAIIQLLVKYGATPERGGMLDDPALSLAARTGNEEAMNILLGSLKSTDSSILQLWRMVTRMQKVVRTEGEAGLIRSLSTWPTSTIANQYLGTVLWTAVERREEACARLLLARGADPNTIIENLSILEVVAWRSLKGEFEEQEFMEMLLNHGSNPNIGTAGRRLLLHAIGYDRIDLVRLYANAGADLDGETLIRAVENRNVEMVRFLLERGVDPKDVAGRFFAGKLGPRYMYAIEHTGQNSREIGELLREYGGED